MSVLEEQLKELQEKFPNATLQALPGNQFLVVVPDYKIPPGWSKPNITIKFIVPTGYPVARPDCFWTDPDLRLARGDLPRSTGANPLPHVSGAHLWFSWHLTAWNPNDDSLLTYVHVIGKRLAEAV
jgi:hypothetical protein